MGPAGKGGEVAVRDIDPVVGERLQILRRWWRNATPVVRMCIHRDALWD